MAFNRKHYREIKKFMKWRLDNRPLFCEVTCPVEWAKTFFPLIKDCADRDDYEGAKGCRDAVIEFLNGFGAEIPDDAVLKL